MRSWHCARGLSGVCQWDQAGPRRGRVRPQVANRHSQATVRQWYVVPGAPTPEWQEGGMRSK